MLFSYLVLLLVASLLHSSSSQSLPGNTNYFSNQPNTYTTRSPNLAGSTIGSNVKLSNSSTSKTSASSLYSLTVSKLNGEQLSLKSYQSQCLLVVNTASASILTQANMRWLNDLQRRITNGSYANRLQLLVVPSDTFGEEPLRESALKSWFELMGARFTTLSLTNINESPLYQTLAAAADRMPVFNNYNKYLVYPNGNLAELYTATAGPEENWQNQVGNIVTLTGKIEQCIAQVAAAGRESTTVPSRHSRSVDDYWERQLSGSAWEAENVDFEDVDEDEEDAHDQYFAQMKVNKKRSIRSVDCSNNQNNQRMLSKLIGLPPVNNDGNRNASSAQNTTERAMTSNHSSNQPTSSTKTNNEKRALVDMKETKANLDNDDDDNDDDDHDKKDKDHDKKDKDNDKKDDDSHEHHYHHHYHHHHHDHNFSHDYTESPEVSTQSPIAKLIKKKAIH